MHFYRTNTVFVRIIYLSCFYSKVNYWDLMHKQILDV